ncbi:DsbA family protein [Patescibacteria group bacterium]|nr:DsbA family protein [Patescibacteria group bacterium]
MGKWKTTILGLIAIILLTGIVWYTDQNKQPIDNQTASVLESADQSLTGSVKLKLSDELFIGNPEASVTIIEYASHFCGFCVDYHLETLPLLVDEYIKIGKVKMVFRLLSPPELSMAVLCANEQGDFQEFNAFLYENIQDIKSVDDLKKAAGLLELNQNEFDQCLDSNKYQEKAVKWFDQATSAGVEGTPTFFINDEKVVGNQPITIFENIIEQELTK